MQKVRILLLVILLAGAATAFVASLAMQERNQPALKPMSVDIDFTPSTLACTLLTKQIAARHLGDGLQSSSANATTNTDDADIASCSYISATKPSHSAILLMRRAKTDAGRQSNQATFTAGQQKNQIVTSYSAPAYWDSTMGQLTVLNGDSLYIVTNGVSAPFKARTLPDALALAHDMRL